MAGYRGKQGRKALPDNVKLLRGTLRNDRVNHSAPHPATKLPSPPRHLSPEAKREWRRRGKELFALGIISTLDVAVFASYCSAWARWVKASQTVDTEGEIVRGKSGPMRSPWMIILENAERDMHRYATEFGMTPSSRNRVHAKPQEDAEDPMEALLSGS